MKHIAMSSKHKERRVRVINRLEAQLVKGVKPSKERFAIEEKLTESDIKRINNELIILKSRI